MQTNHEYIMNTHIANPPVWVARHFDRPDAHKVIRLHYVHDEVIAA